MKPCAADIGGLRTGGISTLQPKQNADAALVMSLDEAVHSRSVEILALAAANPAISEDLALVLLKRSDLPVQAIDQLSKNGSLMKTRKVKLAIVKHPRTPLHISIPKLRYLFNFELMNVALMPAVPGDVKMAAEESLINRLETISQGERLALAHRASGRVTSELLLDLEPRVIHAALENSRLTESEIIKALTSRDALAALINAVCQHPKWSLRSDIRIALLRSEKTSLPQALEFARSLPTALLQKILHNSRLPETTKQSLVKDAEERANNREE